MSSRSTKKSLVSVSGFLVKTPCFGCPAFSTRRPPTSTVISGAVSSSNCARSTSNSSFDIGLGLRRIGAARRERDLHGVSAVLGRLLHGGTATENDQVGQRHFLTRS